MSSAELRALRAELGALRIRLEAQEAQIEEQETRLEEQEERLQRLEGARGETSIEQSSCASEVLDRRSVVSQVTSGSYSVVTSCNRGPVSPEDIEGRLQLARECGAFLLRAVGGDHRQSSGRDRLRLPSKVYVVLVDFGGRRLEPARLCRNFADCKSLCKSGSNCGKSVFLGFATDWEAKEALVTAGIPWPLSA